MIIVEQKQFKSLQEQGMINKINSNPNELNFSKNYKEVVGRNSGFVYIDNNGIAYNINSNDETGNLLVQCSTYNYSFNFDVTKDGVGKYVGGFACIEGVPQPSAKELTKIITDLIVEIPKMNIAIGQYVESQEIEINSDKRGEIIDEYFKNDIDSESFKKTITEKIRALCKKRISVKVLSNIDNKSLQIYFENYDYICVEYKYGSAIYNIENFDLVLTTCKKESTQEEINGLFINARTSDDIIKAVANAL